MSAVERARADELYRLLTLERDAEQVHGTARRAVDDVMHHLDAARQVLAVLETRE